jgi:drug/metabolite transporter (DMT)-like permease
LTLTPTGIDSDTYHILFQMTLHTRGVLYMLLASFFFALMSLCVKVLGNLPVPELIFFRALVSSALCLWGMARLRIHPLGNNRGLLLFRGLAGALSLAQGFWLVQEIPLAAATTLTHLSPIFTTLIGIWFVKENVTPVQMLLFGLSFVGVVMVQGFDYRIAPIHLLVGITASFTMGLAYNCVRKLGRSEHPLVIIFYFPLVCLPLTGIWSALVWVMPQGLEWGYLLLLGIFTQLGQYCMTRAYQHAEISKVAIINYTEVLFAIFLGLALFGENFNLLTYLGMTLVVVGVVLNVFVKLPVSTDARHDRKTLVS